MAGRSPLYSISLVTGIGMIMMMMFYLFTSPDAWNQISMKSMLLGTNNRNRTLNIGKETCITREFAIAERVTGKPYYNSDECFSKLEARKVPNGIDPTQLLSYKFLKDAIYAKFGYRVTNNCQARPWLSIVHMEQGQHDYCYNVFKNWTIANNKSAPRPPPRTMPPEMVEDYLLKNTTGYRDWYFNEHFGSSQFNWGKSVVEQYIDKGRKKQNMAYGNDTQTVIIAAESVPMKGFRAAVIGSIHPWVEAILLVQGVASIVTVEYGKINTDHPQLSYAHPDTIGEQYLGLHQKGTDAVLKPAAFDLIATFSSIEHAGLGRFGDVLDPWADVREMQKMWCMLKPGGIAMIGFEIMHDVMRFNAGRIYGPIRMPFMSAGFEILNIFNSTSKIDLTGFTGSNWPISRPDQLMIVLRKVD